KLPEPCGASGKVAGPFTRKSAESTETATERDCVDRFSTINRRAALPPADTEPKFTTAVALSSRRVPLSSRYTANPEIAEPNTITVAGPAVSTALNDPTSVGWKRTVKSIEAPALSVTSDEGPLITEKPAPEVVTLWTSTDSLPVFRRRN